MSTLGLWLAFGWYLLFPLWVAAGLADYFCHRRTRIEATSGWRESAFHFTMMVQVAIPLLALLFLEINALVMTVVAAGALLHTATFYWDVRYTFDKRAITPFEQLVHSFLVGIPLFAAAMVVILHQSARSDWSLRLKEEPVPATYLLLILGTSMLFNLLPLLEEVWRTTRRAGLPMRRAAGA